MKTIKIKNRDYVMVNERIKYFRALHPTWSIQTEVLKLTDEEAATKTTISDDTGRVISTGMAYEIRKSSMVNSTSWLENCETSSCGRALAFCGIGLENSVASAEEVLRAIQSQENQKEIENAKKATATKTNTQNQNGQFERARV